jgi:hypothetical protein
VPERRLFKRLPPVPRNRILAYIAEPGFEAWKAVRDTIVAPGKSLFDIIEEIDRDYTYQGSILFPSGILVARCSDAVEKRFADLEMFDILPPVG